MCAHAALQRKCKTMTDSNLQVIKNSGQRRQNYFYLGTDFIAKSLAFHFFTELGFLLIKTERNETVPHLLVYGYLAAPMALLDTSGLEASVANLKSCLIILG